MQMHVAGSHSQVNLRQYLHGFLFTMCCKEAGQPASGHEEGTSILAVLFVYENDHQQ